MAETFRAGVRMRRVGRELRRWRERLGITNADAAKLVRWAPSKLSKIENAQQPIVGVEVLALGLVYDVEEDERNRLFNACLTAGDKGWWHRYDESILVPAVTDFVELESEASLLRTFKSDLIPGLLQTERYGTELARRSVPPPSPEVLAQRAAVRTARQARLTGDDPLTVEAVLWEAALRQEVGGPTVMGDQLDHLAKLATRPNVLVQVIPLGSGAFPAMGSSFTILSFREEHHDDVVYLENLTQGLYVEQAADVELYDSYFAATKAVALDTDRSIELITEIADGLKT
jgi:transcriptional regulator with XRE-family HTH domain